MKGDMEKIIARLRKEQIYISLIDDNLKIDFDGDTPPSDLLQTLKDNKQELIQYLKSQEQSVKSEISVVESESGYVLSSSQKRVWVICQFEDASQAYNLPALVDLPGNFKPEILELAIRKVIHHYEILRTVFRLDETGIIKQWIVPSEEFQFNLEVKDFSEESNAIESARKYFEGDAYRPFDLEQGPLIRAALLKIHENGYKFYYNVHHIISDGWSMDVFTQAVTTCYQMLESNGNSELPSLRIQYKDYAQWQQDQIVSDKMQESRTYWMDQLSGELPVMDLPLDKIRPGVQTFKGKTLGMAFDAPLTKALKEKSKELGGTIYTGLLTALYTLFHHYTAQSDFILGSAIAGRNHTELENQIGFFVNTLALRCAFNPQDRLEDLFRKVHEISLQGARNQEYPFDHLIDDLKLKRNMDRSPVFDVMVAFQNRGVVGNQKEESFVANKIEDKGESVSKFDLCFNFAEIGDQLYMDLEFNTDLFFTETIEALFEHFKHVLEHLATRGEVSVGNVNLLSEKESNRLIYELNDTSESFQEDRCMYHLFEEQAFHTPDNKAVVDIEKEITYQELNKRANQLAHHLIEQEGPGNGYVCVHISRKVEMIQAVVAIQKSGKAYLPLEPSLPEARKTAILNRLQIQTILTDSKHLEASEEMAKNADAPVQVLNLDEFEGAAYSEENVALKQSSEDTAYAIFTSGSTGTPKGVVVQHKPAINLIEWVNKTFNIHASDKLLGVASLSFDLSVYDIFGMLATGGSIRLASHEEIANPERLTSVLFEEGITFWNSAPTALQQLMPLIESESEKGKEGKLRLAFMSGDWVPLSIADELKKCFPGIDVISLGGATEATIWSNWYPIQEIDTNWRSIPYGRPIQNAKYYVLNENQKPCPIGVAGDLYIAGDVLAKEYQGQADLTADRFVADPFVSGSRMYKTGDRARFYRDGNMEFLGRLDDQVKLRGYRVELGELESTLDKHASIHRSIAVVEKTKNGDQVLIQYVVAKEDISSEEIKDYLAQNLPSYMIPSHVVLMDQIPMTSNGKVNKKALPKFNEQHLSEKTYVPPKNKIEKDLIAIWGQILALPEHSIGLQDEFFNKGGNSINIMRLRSVISKTFGKEIPVAKLFQMPTVELQARYLGASGAEKQKTVQNNARKLSGDIAVIGMAMRAPGADNVQEYWKNLTGGVESISFLTDDELRESGVSERLIADRNYVKAQSYLEGKTSFDAAFFGYLKDEAKVMDPQTRIFHEVVWSALEDAACDPFSYTGKIGLYAGATPNMDWQAYTMMLNGGVALDAYTIGLLSSRDLMPTLVSNKLNLKGPSVSMYTACSTSLVAIHEACVALKAGECDVALAGGVSVINAKKEGYMYTEGMIASPDGHVRSFDAQANGTVFGEGAGVVVLKPLEVAQEEGDHIVAIVKGSAINNDGNRKVGYTAPSVDGQIEVIEAALQNAGLEPDAISYIEAHGTATRLGDPIEVEALNQVFNKNKFCALGTVKSNIGHLDTAAGVAGFIKTVLSLQNKALVPSLNYSKPNPNINFENSPFHVNTELKEWEATRRCAGVSTFGIGGTNAHVILEEYTVPVSESSSRSKQLVTLSAKNMRSLQQLKHNYVDFLKQKESPSLADIAWTTNTGRAEFSCRSGYVTDSVADLINQLEEGIETGTKTALDTGRVVFMFSGQGAQYVNMAKGLYDEVPVFKQELDRCMAIIQELTGENFYTVLFPEEEQDIRINQTAFTQPLLFSVEYALAKMLNHFGIVPDLMIGHSLGEITAACISGALSLKDALKLVVSRGALMQSLPSGGMLSMNITEEALKPYLNDEVSIAAVNSSDQWVIAGTHEQMDAVQARMESEGIAVRKLHTSHAFHSHMVDPILEPFRKVVEELEYHDIEIPFVSNVTGKLITREEVKNPQYWSDHLRGTVHFHEGAGVLLQGNATLIEVGPGNTLTRFAKQQDAFGEGHQLFGLLRHPMEKVDDYEYFLKALGSVWERGEAINLAQIYEGENRKKISLPTYVFDTVNYEWPKDVFQMIREQASAPSAEKRDHLSDWFHEVVWTKNRVYPMDANAETNWLVFKDKKGGTAGFVEKIKEIANTVVEVEVGDRYEELGENHFRIHPDQEEDYIRLFNALKVEGIHPDHIVHVWSLTNEFPENLYVAHAQEAQTEGFYSLIETVKAYTTAFGNEETQLTVVSNNLAYVHTGEILIPERTTVLGAIDVIDKEYRNIQIKSVDFYKEESSSSILTERETQQLWQELHAEETNNFVAYRGFDRWTRDFQEVKLNGNTEGRVPLKQGGLYLITGGMGGMGLTFARFLKENYDAKLLLTGRSELSREKESLVQELNAVYLQVDVADEAAMNEQLKKAEETFGCTINGIIHTAGLGDYLGTIDKREKEKNEAIFGPKIYGSIVLDRIAQSRNVDFFVLCSSVASAVAPVSQVGYTAANCFQDNLARFRSTHSNTLSISWDAWQEVGMAVDAIQKIHADDFEQFLVNGIRPSEGVEILKQGLANHCGHLIASTVDLKAVIYSHHVNQQIEEAEEEEVLVDRSRLKSDFEAPETETEKVLCKQYAAFFGMEQVGLKDDFFEMGGDSLKAMSVAAKMESEFGVNVPVSVFFECPTPKLMAVYIDEQQRGESVTIAHLPDQDSYVMSSSQKRLWLIDQIEGKSTTYNMHVEYEFTGALQVDSLKQAFISVIDRHEILRTVFVQTESGDLRQVVQTESLAKLELLNAVGKTEEEIRTLVELQLEVVFDMEKGPLLKGCLIQVGADRYVFMYIMHHIISDGWSANILIQDLLASYNAFEKGLPNPLKPLVIQYRDFAFWQQEQLTNGTLESDREYWSEQFAAPYTKFKLPQGEPSETLQVIPNAGTMEYIHFDADKVQRFKALCKEKNATLFMGLLAYTKILIAGLTDQYDLVVGSAVAGRSQSILENQVGFYTNTIALRTLFSEADRYEDVLQHVKQNVLNAYEHQLYPFDELIKDLGMGGSQSGNPLFDVMVSLHNTDILTKDSGEEEMGQVEVGIYDAGPNKTSMFDMTFDYMERGDSLILCLEYRTDLYGEQDITLIKELLDTLLHGITETPEVSIHDLMERVDGLDLYKNTRLKKDSLLAVKLEDDFDF